MIARLEFDETSRYEIGTSCLICGETVPVDGFDYHPKVCEECKNAVMEVRILISELKKLRTGGNDGN